MFRRDNTFFAGTKEGPKGIASTWKVLNMETVQLRGVRAQVGTIISKNGKGARVQLDCGGLVTVLWGSSQAIVAGRGLPEFNGHVTLRPHLRERVVVQLNGTQTQKWGMLASFEEARREIENQKPVVAIRAEATETIGPLRVEIPRRVYSPQELKPSRRGFENISLEEAEHLVAQAGGQPIPRSRPESVYRRR